MEAILSPRGDSVGRKIRPNWLRPLCLWYLGSLQTTKWAKFFSFCKGREEGSQNNSCVASHVLLFSLDGANPCHSIQRRPCLSFGLRDFFCFELQTNVPSSPTQPDLATGGYTPGYAIHDDCIILKTPKIEWWNDWRITRIPPKTVWTLLVASFYLGFSLFLSGHSEIIWAKWSPLKIAVLWSNYNHWCQKISAF